MRVGSPHAPVESAPDACAAGLTGDNAYLQVELRRKTAIQAQLFAAKEGASLHIAHVDERVAHRALDLVSKLAGQHDPGDVGFDELYSTHRVRIGPRSEQ